MSIIESNEQVRRRLLDGLNEMHGHSIVDQAETVRIREGIYCSLSDSYKMEHEAMLDFVANESGETRGFFLQDGEKKGLKGFALEEFADDKEAKMSDEITDLIEKDPFCYFVGKAMLSEEEFKKDKRFKRV